MHNKCSRKVIITLLIAIAGLIYQSGKNNVQEYRIPCNNIQKKEKVSTKIVFHDVTYRKTRECLIKFLEELELING